jgi:pimeloyl-ACP methyl ester carboxylesterase
VDDMFDSFLRDNGLPASLAAAMRDELERVFGQSNRNYDVSSAARLLSQPLLVVHDRDDDRIPFDRAETILRNAPAGRPLIATSGLGHGGALRSREVAKAVAAFAGE